MALNKRDQERLIGLWTTAFAKNKVLTLLGTLIVIALVAGAGYFYLSQDSSTPNSKSSVSPDQTVDAKAVLAKLDKLTVRTDAGSEDYDRDAFGSAWTDSAGNFFWSNNSCDTRNDTLTRDLTNVKYEGSSTCEVLQGEMAIEPYTGQAGYVFDKSKGSSGGNALDIDHIVSLGDAWRSGAGSLSEAEREAIANDPDNLLAVNPSENRKKGDKNAAEYLPPNENFVCKYVAAQVNVKSKYSLTVARDEKAVMQDVLNQC